MAHTRSLAVPLLDRLFEKPIFTASDFDERPEMPGRQTIAALLTRLKQAGILEVLREGSGWRAQILAFPELLNL